MKKLLIGIILCLPLTCAWAQFDKNFIPSPIQDTIPSELFRKLKAKSELDKSKLGSSKSQENVFLKSLYDKRFENIVESFNDDSFIVDSELTDYLSQILNNIYAANPQLPREASIYAFRSASPNALSFGDGTIGFTLGLLARMENEAEIAFVICHELAHYHARHADQQMAQLAKMNYDKEIKKKIDAARKSEYGQYGKLNDVFMSLGFSITQHSRAHENEADSLGLTYFTKTSYNPWAAVRLMEILDSADVSQYQQNIDFATYFNFKKFPFKPVWAEYSKSTMWHASTKVNDSLRTHPDCQNRIIALQRQLARLGMTDKQPLVRDAKAEYIAKTAEFEIVETLYHFKQYGKALFRSLALLESYPHNIYLSALVGRCLDQLFIYQRNHELSKVLDLPAPQFNENYDRFLTFIHKLRLVEIGSLAYYYTITRDDIFFQDEEFIYTLWRCSSLPMSEIDADKVKEDYLALFPNGKHRRELKSNEPKTTKKH